MAAVIAPHSPAPLPDDFLDVLAQARSADEGLRRIDAYRRLVAPDSIFSIQQNVTTAADPVDEIRLRRFHSSQEAHYPVNGTKRKTLSPWTECLFLHGQVFVGEGADALARHFDDYPQMRRWRLQSVVNVPLLQGNTCYATFNVFGTRPAWTPQQVTGIRLLALATTRWVPVAHGLAYRFSQVSAANSMEV
jgi:hypothetical protein